MMRHFLLFSFLLLSATACNKLGDEHLPPAKMEQVIYDVSLAETYSTQAKDNIHFGGMKNTDSLSIYYKEVFAHHKITQDQFTQSMKWYKDHPDDLDSIYTHISVKADKIQAEEAKKIKK